jgi:hypothetical protein
VDYGVRAAKACLLVGGGVWRWVGGDVRLRSSSTANKDATECCGVNVRRVERVHNRD